MLLVTAQYQSWGMVCCKCAADFLLQNSRIRMFTKLVYMLLAMLVGRRGLVLAVLIKYSKFVSPFTVISNEVLFM